MTENSVASLAAAAPEVVTSSPASAASASAATTAEEGPTVRAELCAGCRQPITDRYLLRALDGSWHEDCLRCSCCDCRLGEVGSTLFTRSNLLLCRRDYLRSVCCHQYTLCRKNETLETSWAPCPVGRYHIVIVIDMVTSYAVNDLTRHWRAEAGAHCNRLTTVQDIQDYASLIFWDAVYMYSRSCRWR